MGAAAMSGCTPSGATLLWSGVNQRLIVIRTPPSFSRRDHTWTVFLPNDGSPTTVARPLSLSAAATISDADADPPLIRTATGRSGSVATPSPVDSHSRTSSPADSWLKMSPEPMNWLAICCAASM